VTLRSSDGVLPPRLGLAANAGQFALLVLINAFVGAMIGQERVLLPLLAEQEFGLASRTAVLSFIASFGLVKALSNLLAGHWSARYGRRRLLIAGWLAGLPVPLLLIAAPSWSWVIAANLLLGINQGLCWSTTVIMKIDLVGPRHRGFAMGLNEFAGYGAVALAALGTGYLAASSGTLRPGPFYPGVVIAVLGLALSLLFVRDTSAHAAHEASLAAGGAPQAVPGLRDVFARTSWTDRTLFGASQAGLVNNLNDGVVWGLVPIALAASGFTLREIALVAALYPGVWCVLQVLAGAWSDRIGRRPLIVAGMLIQAVGIALFAAGSRDVAVPLTAAVLLGIGTALVYPTLIAAVSDRAEPAWRAPAVGVYRLWRDGGYVAGALLAGVLADVAGLAAALAAVAVLTALSGVVAATTMTDCAHGSPARAQPIAAEVTP
jgi:MFS family permease